MAIAFIICITLRLKLVGLFGSFFLKKYIKQIYVNFFLNKFQLGYNLFFIIVWLLSFNNRHNLNKKGPP